MGLSDEVKGKVLWQYRLRLLFPVLYILKSWGTRHRDITVSNSTRILDEAHANKNYQTEKWVRKNFVPNMMKFSTNLVILNDVYDLRIEGIGCQLKQNRQKKLLDIH